MADHFDDGSPFFSCDSCGALVLPERAFAPMETLDVFCGGCLREKLKPCEGCGDPIFAAAYQHLPSGRVLCERCVLRELSS